MVSLDDAVVARLEKGGKRYEILVDPELVDDWKADNDSVPLDNYWRQKKSGMMHVVVKDPQKRN